MAANPRYKKKPKKKGKKFYSWWLHNFNGGLACTVCI